MINPSIGVPRRSLLGALIAGEASSIYATFFGNILTPFQIYLVDRATGRRLPSGHIGYIVEVFSWEGVISVVALSVVVSILTFCLIRIAAKNSTEFPKERHSEVESLPSGVLLLLRPTEEPAGGS